MSLSDTSVRTARIESKPYKLFDEKGLYLLVNSNGARLWRFKYRFDGVEKLLALGSYPEVSLKLARARREDARALLASNVDPNQRRRADKAASADTFAAVAEEWLQTKKATLSDSTWQRDRDQLVKMVGPYLGARPIAQIEAPELLAVLRRLEKAECELKTPAGRPVG